MATLVLNTLQNVKIELELASVGQRILARLFDFLIIIVYIFLQYHLFESLNNIDLPIVETIKNYLLGSLFILLNVPLLLYDVMLEYYFEGQSFGKKIMSIKVVQIDGTTPELRSYFMRWLLTFIELWPPIGFMGITGLFVISVTKSQQRLGDVAANTCVISLKSRYKFEDTIFREVMQSYKPTYPQAIQLTDRDVAIINAILHSYKSSASNHQNDTYSKVASRVCEVLNISETVGNPKDFLATIIKDYNALVFDQQDQL